MKLGERFLSKFTDSIIASLSCFDRVIFKGHLPFGDDRHLNAYVDHSLKMRRKDFLPFLEKRSQELIDHAQHVAQQAGRPYQYLNGPHRKEKIIADLIHKDRLSQGLVAVLCCQETCRTVKLRYAQGRPELVFARRPQRVVYFYWLDAQFGLIYVRVQSWFPYTIQVYVNGHDWLARQMTKRKLGFVQRDNAFTQLDSPEAAQRLADKFLDVGWVGRLSRWAQQVNPLLKQDWLNRASYYWVIEQAEYSTDILFRDRATLQPLYRRLLDHATVNLSAADILTFLGRKLHPNFQGEVQTDCKKDRLPGARVKHRVKDNWLKMYDKFGQILRIETVINQPREFRVRRRRMRDGHRRTVWCPMNKGVANLYRYRQVALAANRRYLDALSVVDDPRATYQRVEYLARSVQKDGRRYAGFNPALREDVRLLTAVLDGRYTLNGFRNADIRAVLHPATTDPTVTRRQAAALSRVFRRLHVRGALAKIPNTRRWRVTTHGQQQLSTIVRLYHHGLATAA